jgi:hypothetical protein
MIDMARPFAKKQRHMIVADSSPGRGGAKKLPPETCHPEV